MYHKIAENIYQIKMPLPNNPLRELNAYLITGERNLLIDTGFNRPECEETLRQAFRALGISSTDVFVTHLHSDHCGLICKLNQRDAILFAGEIDGELINFEAGNLYWKMLDDLFIRFGFPKADFGRNTDIHPGRKYCHEGRVDFTYVAEGDVLQYGGYRLEAIQTPGHTPGHMCLYDRENKRLFCGDHILGTITPNICVEICADNPLRDYLDSLKKVEGLEVDLLLTAHGTPVENMQERIRQLQEHHAQRLSEVLQILEGESKTAYQVAADMTWEISCKDWADFPLPQKWFATGEAISHLQYLYYEGRIMREQKEGIYFYHK